MSPAQVLMQLPRLLFLRDQKAIEDFYAAQRVAAPEPVAQTPLEQTHVPGERDRDKEVAEIVD